MNDTLVGHWLIESIDIAADRVVTLIGGLPGECAEFTADGRFRSDATDGRPTAGRYRVVPGFPYSGLDHWVAGMEPYATRCLFHIEGARLTICVAGDKGPRPTAIRRDDHRPWCVIRANRTTRPGTGRKQRVEPLLEGGSAVSR